MAQQIQENEAKIRELSDHVYTNEHVLAEVLEQMQKDNLGDVTPGGLRVGGDRGRKPSH